MTTKEKIADLESRVRAVMHGLQDETNGVADVLFDVAEELSLLQQDMDLLGIS